MAKWTVLAIVAALLTPPARAQAQPLSDYTAAVVTTGNKCLIPDTKRELRVFDCASGGARYWISNGVVRTKDGFCFDHGVPQGADLTRNNAVRLVKCHGGKSQVWYFIRDGRALVQSAANSAACITVEGEQAGARALVSQCTYTNPPAVQKFFPGESITPSARQVLTNVVPRDALQAFSTRGSATFSTGTRMVAAGGGNIIVATMVAAGGGNILPSGAGNVLPSGAGNMVAAGGGNLIGNDGGSLRGLFANASLVR
jgi:hypothetical protein